MRPLYIYLICSIGLVAGTQQAHGQLSQALNDFKFDRPFQYAPGDPWTRSKLFKLQTKHFGFGYNCDGEECKRSSPYICWKHHTENDLPCKTGCCQRLKQTASDVKQRIADGNCVQCAQAEPCQSCQQAKCGGCCDCQSPINFEFANNEPNSNSSEALVIQRPRLKTVETKPQVLPPSSPTRSAGLESLDIQVR